MTDKRLYSTTPAWYWANNSHFAHFKNRWRGCWEAGGGRGEGGRGGQGIQIWFQIWFICDSDQAAQIPPGFVGRSLIRACLCMLQKLTSCSSMAVDVEAEVSATKRSQVEVTKILPDWTKEGTEKTIRHQTLINWSYSCKNVEECIALYREVFVI